MRSWIKTRPKWLLVLCATALAATVVAVPVALASDLFTDVPDANPFHNDIGAIARAGITQGKTCVPPGTPPTYCPGENVTREAMAAFMHRGFGRVAEASDSAEAFNSPTDVVPGHDHVDPGPPLDGARRSSRLHQGRFQRQPRREQHHRVPVRVLVRGRGRDDRHLYRGLVHRRHDQLRDPRDDDPGDGRLPVTGTAPRTIHLVSHLESGTGTADIFWQATASYFPFGSTGTNVLRESWPGQGKAQRQGRRKGARELIPAVRARPGGAQAPPGRAASPIPRSSSSTCSGSAHAGPGTSSRGRSSRTGDRSAPPSA